MKKLTLLSLFIILLSSCEKNNNTCDCKDPLQDLAWLKDLKNSMTNCVCEESIFQATYKEQTVFYVAGTDPLCNGIDNIEIRDCDGNILKTHAVRDETFSNEVTDRKVLYRCKTK